MWAGPAIPVVTLVAMSYTFVRRSPIFVLTGRLCSNGNASLDPLELPPPDTAIGLSGVPRSRPLIELDKRVIITGITGI